IYCRASATEATTSSSRITAMGNPRASKDELGRKSIKSRACVGGESLHLVNGKKSPAALFVPYHPWTAPVGPTSGRPNALLRVCRTSASLPAAKGATFAAYVVS